MVNLIYLICLLIAFLTGFFTAIKAVHIGLKWQIQMKQDKEPELKTPIVDDIKQSIQEHKQAKSDEETKTLYDEWVNGAKE